VLNRTPVIIGVGEASERIGESTYVALSPVELAARAAQAAIEDAAASAFSPSEIELIASIRQFEVSGPKTIAPFGKSSNFPRSVGRRIGADPARAVLEAVGGQGPQHLVNELVDTVARGEIDLALICGSEAISTVRNLTSRHESRDWSEEVVGPLEDRGYQLDGLASNDLIAHGVRTPVQNYALFENARRAKRGLCREAYQHEMGQLFEPFTTVAARNPHAMSRQVLSADELARISAANRLVVDPFPRRLVSRDQANQGAAILISSIGKARALGVPEEKWIYLHGGADVVSRRPLERDDLSSYPAAGLASRGALNLARITVDDVAMFDLYSCFPIAVFAVQEELGLSRDDSRPLTVTGGLPFFGGAGNNYSMHAIATMVRRLRDDRGAYGLVGANGGYLSKYSVGIYSARPTEWRGLDSRELQSEIDTFAAPAMAAADLNQGVIETYTIDYGRDVLHGILVCRTAAGGRFVAMTDPSELQIVDTMVAVDPLGARVTCRRDDRGRRVVARLDPR
jgi:acetyl-CoA C-acetyltransferase